MKYIITESQLKKIVSNTISEQYSGMNDAEDIFYVQKGLNKYFKDKNIKGVWKGKDFVENPQGQLLIINTDSAWGDKSKSAMATFQKKHGLEMDGIIGCRTVKKMVETGYLTRDIWGTLMSKLGWDKKCD